MQDEREGDPRDGQKSFFFQDSKGNLGEMNKESPHSQDRQENTFADRAIENEMGEMSISSLAKL